ncbi:hypothetical protein BDF20DRAFT_257876 [Mycotypha africana]|uniref:uncharacterized protein n=1 Tax=Mycotypha africana TaxID=64632 RepID=UPI00230159B7|nr:uncharacterized protein BDF20DRAFT_257876 [Mycotypha africana]KAI8987325.1 hypothetical protein BDF20DRAFT_257876 [Mycotypha africana]
MVIDKLMKPIKIIVMDNTQFRVILDNFCLRKKLKKDELVLVYNDDVVFLSATPGGIGMDTIGTNQMKVYPKTCYDSMMKEKEEKKLERLPAETEEVNEQKIRLQLRDKENKCFPVTISLSKKLEALIQFYKKQTGCSTNVNLSLDGEIMDSSMMINETDLEDEDMIDVVQA